MVLGQAVRDVVARCPVLGIPMVAEVQNRRCLGTFVHRVVPRSTVLEHRLNFISAQSVITRVLPANGETVL